MPYPSTHTLQPTDMEVIPFAMSLWKEKVHFIGAGTIGIAAIQTLLTLMKPMVEDMRLSFRNFGGVQMTERTEQDLSPKAVIAWVLVMMPVLGVSFFHFIGNLRISGGLAWLLVVVYTLLVLIIGSLVVAACGYMAGSVGSSSSPISGAGIVSIVIISLVLLLVDESGGLMTDKTDRKFLLALTLFCGALVICVASISNDNLQNLKTGHPVKATPRKQQVALVVGCVVGALVVSPTLELSYEAYSSTGAIPCEGMDVAQALAAPQATLMTTIAQGIFLHNPQWDYIFAGVGIGMASIAVDFTLRKSSSGKRTLPVLTMGMGIYLPPSVNIPIAIGAVLAAVLKSIIARRQESREGRLKNTGRIDTLFSVGLIVGESLIGVTMAFTVAFSVTSGGPDAPLVLNLGNWDTAAKWLGLASFVFSMLVPTRRVLKAGR